MQIPSRFMPKFKSREIGPFGSFIFTLLIFSPFLFLMWKFPVTVVAVPIIFVWQYLIGQRDKEHFNQLSKGRDGESICTFSRHFNCHYIDTWIIRAVYEEIYDYVKIPIRPTDDVIKDLKIDEEDFEWDIVEAIAKRTGRSLENCASNPYYGKANTLEGLVFFFNCQPREQVA